MTYFGFYFGLIIFIFHVVDLAFHFHRSHLFGGVGGGGGVLCVGSSTSSTIWDSVIIATVIKYILNLINCWWYWSISLLYLFIFNFQVFRLQVDNGIPIESWFDDPSDRALISLLPFLETLAAADDVRPIIAEKFSIKV